MARQLLSLDVFKLDVIAREMKETGKALRTKIACSPVRNAVPKRLCCCHCRVTNLSALIPSEEQLLSITAKGVPKEDHALKSELARVREASPSAPILWFGLVWLY